MVSRGILLRKLAEEWTQGLEPGQEVCYRDLRLWIVERRRDLRMSPKACVSAMKSCPGLRHIGRREGLVRFVKE